MELPAPAYNISGANPRLSDPDKQFDAALNLFRDHTSLVVAKGLVMIRRAISARSGRATTYSQTGPYRPSATG